MEFIKKRSAICVSERHTSFCVKFKLSIKQIQARAQAWQTLLNHSSAVKRLCSTRKEKRTVQFTMQTRNVHYR